MRDSKENDAQNILNFINEHSGQSIFQYHQAENFTQKLQHEIMKNSRNSATKHNKHDGQFLPPLYNLCKTNL